jgi:hypothetical protein
MFILQLSGLIECCILYNNLSKQLNDRLHSFLDIVGFSVKTFGLLFIMRSIAYNLSYNVNYFNLKSVASTFEESSNISLTSPSLSTIPEMLNI